ncbi:TIGR02530 family flagellar biosynthesis protein [Sporolactobacillus sp. Y61]|jgi:flagellar operon protein|uniref:TIGR02530 family flagellar biosynthesis protein n=1 Tax=Sporolactobacillus sp. Y61 TaxID=3160863 RepID=A0AAU8ICW4_9BACL|nr:TIGR02530 family flagellar biosynthesis protein [Sporolactobacillus sp. THM19-2]RYL92954.1 flagellar operon protein [Sporolactobacillus sp. THM19-2]
MNKISDHGQLPFIHPAVHSLSTHKYKPSAEKSSFRSELDARIHDQPVKMSKHARQRMSERDIHLSASEWNQIGEKLHEAERMGIRDSLILTKDVALVVNAPNHTVITAMDLQEAGSHIFTNINGTIIINH